MYLTIQYVPYNIKVECISGKKLNKCFHSLFLSFLPFLDSCHRRPSMCLQLQLATGVVLSGVAQCNTSTPATAAGVES